MKDNNNLVSGKIKDDAQTLDALALYFVRFLQDYKAEGVNVSMVMPQNEPSCASKYTSCLWTGDQLAKFIGYHLGPALKKNGMDTGIFLGTICDSSHGGYSNWIEPSMKDPAVRQYVGGVGCQWAGDVTLTQTHKLFPDLKLMQTETECGSRNFNDWAFGEKQFALAQKWFGAGASINTIWNLVLDETGNSTANWAQCSPVVVDSKTAKVTYTPFYYCYKHFSHFVQPGAHVIATESPWAERVAFVNPNGEAVVVVGNSSNSPLPVSLTINGKQFAPVELPAHSFNTFTLNAN